MGGNDEIRDGELAVVPPPATDAGLAFIGRIRTPWTSRDQTPRQGKLDGPVCKLEIFDPWLPALQGLEQFQSIEVIYWLHKARRDMVLQRRRTETESRGTFSVRSPLRPNPIGISRVKLVGVEGNVVSVQGLDCLDGTPLIDIKPDYCQFSPEAPPAS